MTTVELPAAEQQGPPTGTADGQAYRRATRAFRPRRVIPAAIVAALLAAGSLLTAAEVFSRWLDRPLDVLPVGWLSRLGRETAWDAPLALLLSVVAIGLGLWLLVLAVWPGRLRVVPVRSGHADAITVVGNRALARYAAAAAETVDGVDRARVTVRRGRVRVRAGSPLHAPDDLPRQVHQVVGDRLRQLAPLRPLRLRVVVRGAKEYL